MAHEMAEAAKVTIKANQPNKSIEIEAYKERPEIAFGNCSGIVYECFAFALENIINLLLNQTDWDARRAQVAYLVVRHLVRTKLQMPNVVKRRPMNCLPVVFRLELVLINTFRIS